MHFGCHRCNTRDFRVYYLVMIFDKLWNQFYTLSDAMPGHVYGSTLNRKGLTIHGTQHYRSTIGTLNMIFSVTNSNSLKLNTICKSRYSVTNTKMLIQHYMSFLVIFLSDYIFSVVQLLSLTKWFFIQTSIIRDNHNLLTREGRVLANG